MRHYNRKNGNALIYILIAIALIAALAYAISRDGGGQSTRQMDESRFNLHASDLIARATSARIAVEQMNQWGISYDQMLFDLPGTAGYTTNTSQQIYHPQGGGLTPFNTKEGLFDSTGTTGWAFQGNINVDWTNTTGSDLIYSFINVAPEICAQINNDLVGSTTIPVTTVNFTNTFTENGSDADFAASECAECENKPALCISDGTTYAFYNIIGAR